MLKMSGTPAQTWNVFGGFTNAMRMSIAIGHNNVIRKNDVDVIIFSWLSKGICQVVDFLEITLVLSAGGFEFIGDIKLGPTSIGGLTIFVVYLAGMRLECVVGKSGKIEQKTSMKSQDASTKAAMRTWHG